MAHGEGMKSALLLLLAAAVLGAQPAAEGLIEAGHWKRARALVEARMREAPNDPLAIYLTSQIRFAFGDANTPLKLAEKALALDGGVGRHHRQMAEVTSTPRLRSTQRKPRGHPEDIQSLRDMTEFYLPAPGIEAGNKVEALAAAERIGRIDRGQGFSAKRGWRSSIRIRARRKRCRSRR
jgi:hypothetical protein